MFAQVLDRYGDVDVLQYREVPTPVPAGRSDNHDYLRRLGAVPVEYGAGLLGRLEQVAPHGVDRALDCAGHGFVGQIIDVLPADRIITIVDFEAGAHGVRLAGGDPLDLYADSFRSVLPPAAAGRFATEIAAEFPLAQLADAHQMSEAGHLRGKIVVQVADLDAERR